MLSRASSGGSAASKAVLHWSGRASRRLPKGAAGIDLTPVGVSGRLMLAQTGASVRLHSTRVETTTAPFSESPLRPEEGAARPSIADSLRALAESVRSRADTAISRMQDTIVNDALGKIRWKPQFPPKEGIHPEIPRSVPTGPNDSENAEHWELVYSNMTNYPLLMSAVRWCPSHRLCVGGCFCFAHLPSPSTLAPRAAPDRFFPPPFFVAQFGTALSIEVVLFSALTMSASTLHWLISVPMNLIILGYSAVWTKIFKT